MWSWNLVLPNQTCVLVLHHEGHDWCPLHIVKSACFLNSYVITLTTLSEVWFLSTSISCLCGIVHPSFWLCFLTNKTLWSPICSLSISTVCFDWYFFHLMACFSDFDYRIFKHGKSLKWQQLFYGWHFSFLYIEVFPCVPNIAHVESSTSTAFWETSRSWWLQTAVCTIFCSLLLSNFFCCTVSHKGHTVAQLVEALHCKSEGCGFDSWWCQWIFSLT
jgi:hypothetical protein